MITSFKSKFYYLLCQLYYKPFKSIFKWYRPISSKIFINLFKIKKQGSKNLVFNTIPAANKLALKLVKINNQETIKSRYYHTLVSIEI